LSGEATDVEPISMRDLLISGVTAMRGFLEGMVRTARLAVGVPDYEDYLQCRRTSHPEQPVMTYEEFIAERQEARFAVEKGRLKSCC
jgi:uncharacterized short protein YbdD (DUF466 family)